MEQNQIVPDATGALVNDLISDFTADTYIKVIYVQSFPTSNKTFVTIEDVDFVPTKQRPEKRCTVELSHLDDCLVLGL